MGGSHVLIPLSDTKEYVPFSDPLSQVHPTLSMFSACGLSGASLSSNHRLSLIQDALDIRSKETENVAHSFDYCARNPSERGCQVHDEVAQFLHELFFVD